MCGAANKVCGNAPSFSSEYASLCALFVIHGHVANDPLHANDEAFLVPLVAEMSLPVSEIGQHQQFIVFCGLRDYVRKVLPGTGAAATLSRHGL